MLKIRREWKNYSGYVDGMRRDTTIRPLDREESMHNQTSLVHGMGDLVNTIPGLMRSHLIYRMVWTVINGDGNVAVIV